MTEGEPTNGYLPARLENYSVFCWGAVGRSNFFLLFSKEITLLVTVIKLVNKGDDRYNKCAKRKQLCVCDHAIPPLRLSLRWGN